MSGASYANASDIVAQSIEIGEDAIIIAYMTPADVRDRGKVVQVHQIQISRRHKQYRDGVETVVEAVQDLLKDVLEDWPHKEPYTPITDDDDD